MSMLAQQAGNRIPQAKARLLGYYKLVRQHGDDKMQGRKRLEERCFNHRSSKLRKKTL